MTEKKVLRQQQDELSLSEMIGGLRSWTGFFLKRWLLIGTVATVFALAGLAYSLIKKTMYNASYTFVLVDNEQNSMGMAAGLASLVGLNLSSNSGSNPLFQGDNIYELYRSRLMLTKALLTPTAVRGKRMLMVDRYINMRNLRDDWKNEPWLATLSFDTPQDKFSILQDSLISTFVEEINEHALEVGKLEKKLNIINVSFEAEDQVFARDFVTILVSDVNRFYTQTRTKKENMNVEKLQRQADSVRVLLYGSIQKTADAEDANPNPNEGLKRLSVGARVRRVDAEATSVMYQEIVKNLEISRMALSREMPLIQELDKPILPLKKIKPRKLVCLAGFGFVGALFAIAWLAIVRMYREETTALA